MAPIYISFDCAVKTFAFCVIERNDITSLDVYERQFQVLSKMLSCARTVDELTKIQKYLTTLETKINNFVTIHDYQVLSLSAEDDSETALTRHVAVIKTLTAVLKEIKWKPDKVVIEYQMAPNFASRTISDALISHYFALCPYLQAKDIILIGPSVKNSFSFSPSCALSQYCHLSKYIANKNHARDNFVRWCYIFGVQLKYPSALIGHCADAFMQAISLVLADSP